MNFLGIAIGGMLLFVVAAVVLGVFLGLVVSFASIVYEAIRGRPEIVEDWTGEPGCQSIERELHS